MAVFRGMGWSWLPRATADQWVVAGVFGVVAGGVATAWVLRDRGQASEDGDEPQGGGAIGGQPGSGGWLWIRRTGLATARRGGKAHTGVSGVGAGARVRIGRTGDVEASGPGSVASSGVDLSSQR